MRAPTPCPPLQDAKIKHLLDNVDTSGKSSLADKVEGMKYILAVRIGDEALLTRAALLSLQQPPAPCSLQSHPLSPLAQLLLRTKKNKRAANGTRPRRLRLLP